MTAIPPSKNAPRRAPAAWGFVGPCLLAAALALACGGQGAGESGGSAVDGTATVPEAIPLETEKKIQVEAEPIPFHREDPSLGGIESVRFRAAFELTSPAVRFGGFSGLVIDGERLLAISDRGHWWSHRLEVGDDGTLLGLERGGALGPIPFLDGTPVEGRLEHDAEDLIAWSEGFLVSFEVTHRIQHHVLPSSTAAPSVAAGAGDGVEGDAAVGEAGGEPDRHLRAPGIPWPTPDTLSAMGENSGLEAMTRLLDGRLLILSEDGRDPEGRLLGWVGGPTPESPWHPMTLGLPEDLHPTAAATLPSGEVLLLERGWNPTDGVTIRLSTFSVPDSPAFGEPPAPSESIGHAVPRRLALLRPPMAIDNFEAMDLAAGPNGEVLVYLLSDDNYSDSQRTLLLQWELLPGDPPAAGRPHS